MSVATEQSERTTKAATAAGDRRFRPDVQGLRAVAIALVVLFHAGVPGFGGGFVGVDVFFVISGFVITGVLLNERDRSGRTSIPSFYGRRARRIIPAATLVIVVTVVAAYHYLGSVTGHETAVDGKWAAVFLANFHFASSATNYLASQHPPSALQNYWSLAVEEQFYIVYPAIFVLAAGWARRRFSLRGRLALVLVAVIAASFTYSVVLTPANPPGAFFSPLTRAWELALGGLIAVGGDRLRRMPHPVAALTTWLGLGAIAVADLTLNSTSVYPGSLVAIPVVGAGLVIAGGSGQPLGGAELVLRRRPFQLLGLISYSLYLWHWPILVIAAQSRGATTLPVWDNVWLILLATALAAVTYRIIENPVRHARFLMQRRWASIALGLVLIGATLIVTSSEQDRPGLDLGSIGTVTSGSVCPSPRPAEVSHLTSEFDAGRAQLASAPSQVRSVVLIGDSTSCTMLPGLDAVGPAYGLQIHNGAVVGCGIVSGRVAPYTYAGGVDITAYTALCQGESNNAESIAIDRYHPQLIVWGSTDEREGIEVDTRSGSKVLNSGSGEWRSVMLRRMDDRVNEFIAAGARVVLLEEPPSIGSGSGADATDAQYEHMNALLREVSAQHPHRVALVDLAARVCPSGPPCPYVLDGLGSTSATLIDAVRPDGIHYSPTGALWVARWLVPQIAAAARNLS